MKCLVFGSGIDWVRPDPIVVSADDPAVAAVLVDILIDEDQLFKPNAG